MLVEKFPRIGGDRFISITHLKKEICDQSLNKGRKILWETPRRFNLLSELVADIFPKDFRLADIAAGKGFLQAALREKGFSDITSWDKRGKTNYNFRGHRYGWFNYQLPETYQGIVGMHPDEATDHAILYAGKHRCVAILCPCCVKPSAAGYWGKHTYPKWIDHLIQLGEIDKLSCEIRTLKMNGRSDVLIFKP